MPPLFLRSDLHRRFNLSTLHSSGAVFLVALIGLGLCWGTSGAACVDYEDYIHGVGAVDMSSPRDLAVAGSYAYVADGVDDLQIIDIAEPSAPAVVGNLSLTGEQRGIAVAGQYGYTVWVSGNAGGLHVVKLSTPVSPVVIATLNLTGRPRAWR